MSAIGFGCDGKGIWQCREMFSLKKCSLLPVQYSFLKPGGFLISRGDPIASGNCVTRGEPLASDNYINRGELLASGNCITRGEPLASDNHHINRGELLAKGNSN